MATPTIPNGEAHFFPILYEGNGGGQRVGKFVPFTDNGTIANSLLFEASENAYLSKTFSSDGNRKTFTISVWFKRTKLGGQNFITSTGASSSNRLQISIETDNTINVEAKTSGSDDLYLRTSRTFEDTSKWYHLLLAVDSTATSGADSEKAKLYIDGDLVTSDDLQSPKYPGDNDNLQWNAGQEHMIGKRTYASVYCDGYLAEFNNVDGSALTPSTFGVTDTSSGRWVPKALTGITYGTNGFRFQFASTSNFGDDTAGSNDFSVNNLVPGDQTTDSPTQNHATLSPHSAYKSGNFTLSRGNLKATSTSTSGTHSGQGGMRIPSGGKYYWECEIDAGKDGMGIGVIPTDTPTTSANPSTATLYLSNGSMRTDGSNAISYGSGVDNGNIMGFALDLSNPSAGKLYVSVNGVYENSGNPVTGANPAPSNQLTGDLRVIYQDGSNGFEPVYIYNFGQKSFNTAPPTGFVALQQDNLPETAKGVSGLVWMKNRDANDNHQLYDSSRGAQIALTPNTTGAESTVVDGLQKFLAGGQQIEDNNLINTSGESFVSWNWVANGGTTESISAAGEFDIASTVQKNLTAGFSIVQYTGNGNSTDGQGVGHGLGAEPKWIIIKELTGDSWNCWHGAFGNEKILLNDPGKKFSSTAFGNYTPSSTIFKVRGNNTNASSTNYVAYCWKEIAGYSKFGSYGGGGSVTPFIYTGFQPALIIIKCTSDNSTDWVMYDNKRDPINVNATQSTTLYPNLPDDDASAGGIHFFSNGFQPKSTNGFNNGTSRSYIYIAFSKNDFLGDGTSPMTAR